MEVSPEKKIYFLSDFHLGSPDYSKSLEREKKVVAFLESIRPTAKAIFIVGDIFDFWFEYKHVVPKGYVRLLGKLAEITDSGIPIHFFVGNHDMWMRNYFQEELNIPVFFDPQTYEWNNKKFFIGHGDGLGPGDHGFKMMKKVFRSPLSQALFGLLHPTIGVGVANYFSRKSRKKTGTSDEVFLGEDKEWLIIFCREILTKEHFDYFIFGHRHLPLDFELNPTSHYINLGDWIKYFTYAEFDGHTVLLKYLHSS
jgi:UDP-2,3-diacylglucosamine hydrolase